MILDIHGRTHRVDVVTILPDGTHRAFCVCHWSGEFAERGDAWDAAGEHMARYAGVR